MKTQMILILGPKFSLVYLCMFFVNLVSRDFDQVLQARVLKFMSELEMFPLRVMVKVYLITSYSKIRKIIS